MKKKKKEPMAVELPKEISPFSWPDQTSRGKVLEYGHYYDETIPQISADNLIFLAEKFNTLLEYVKTNLKN